jgi:hypothetical protein
MRNILALIGAAVVVFGGLGWYLGWYQFDLATGTDGKVHINGNVDTTKIVDDSKKFGEKVGKVVDGAKDKGEPTKPAEFVGPPAPPDMPTRPTAPTVRTPTTLPRGTNGTNY